MFDRREKREANLLMSGRKLRTESAHFCSGSVGDRMLSAEASGDLRRLGDFCGRNEIGLRRFEFVSIAFFKKSSGS